MSMSRFYLVVVVVIWAASSLVSCSQEAAVSAWGQDTSSGQDNGTDTRTGHTDADADTDTDADSDTDTGTDVEPGYECSTNCKLLGVCGDGVIQDGEECDDANADNDDKCSNLCKNNIYIME